MNEQTEYSSKWGAQAPIYYKDEDCSATLAVLVRGSFSYKITNVGVFTSNFGNTEDDILTNVFSTISPEIVKAVSNDLYTNKSFNKTQANMSNILNNAQNNLNTNLADKGISITSIKTDSLEFDESSKALASKCQLKPNSNQTTTDEQQTTATVVEEKTTGTSDSKNGTNVIPIIVITIGVIALVSIIVFLFKGKNKNI